MSPITTACLVLLSAAEGEVAEAGPPVVDGMTALRIAGAIATMLIAGVFAGYVAYLFGPPAPDELNDERKTWLRRRAILLGMLAALVVPLFVRLIGAAAGNNSDMIKDILDGTAGLDAWFVLAGLCLIAAFSARRFVGAVTDIVLKQLERKVEENRTETRQMGQELGDEIRDLSEDVEMEMGEVLPRALADGPALSDNAQQVLRAMAKLPTKRTSPEDIAEATGLGLDIVRQGLDELATRKLVQRRDDAPDGRQRWRIRAQGRARLG